MQVQAGRGTNQSWETKDRRKRWEVRAEQRVLLSLLYSEML